MPRHSCDAHSWMISHQIEWMITWREIPWICELNMWRIDTISNFVVSFQIICNTLCTTAYTITRILPLRDSNAHVIENVSIMTSWHRYSFCITFPVYGNSTVVYQHRGQPLDYQHLRENYHRFLACADALREESLTIISTITRTGFACSLFQSSINKVTWHYFVVVRFPNGHMT